MAFNLVYGLYAFIGLFALNWLIKAFKKCFKWEKPKKEKKKMKVKNFMHQNQFIIIDDEHNTTTFQSYQSEICTIKRNEKVLKVFNDWNYSMTTLRHFKAFIETYTNFNYYDLKKELQKGITEFSY